ncbi:hypothetical protein BGT96224_2160 [Blumeria graminis f. sp. tritici 96224]|nr:hypothetical protein BGT96224_2160 [Blumeria graminis f. sp. tritici 96224]
MTYLLFYSAFLVLIITTCIVLYLTRSMWIRHLPALPGSSFIYSRLPSNFVSDMENGLSSPEFDLSSNIAAGDTRRGLDDNSKREIQGIMKSRRVNFDEARRIFTEGCFAKNDISSDGLPRDPKFVCFS